MINGSSIGLSQFRATTSMGRLSKNAITPISGYCVNGIFNLVSAFNVPLLGESALNSAPSSLGYGMLLQLQDLCLAPGGELLLDKASWTLNSGQHVGIVGRNGTGKTSLIRCIVGEALPFSGQIKTQPNLEIGYLPQTAVSGSELSLWEEARTALGKLEALKAELDAAEQAMQSGEARAIERYSTILEHWQNQGGYTEDEQIGRVLHGLGFSASDWKRPCHQFSGGWQMRIALAKLLLSQPTLAILDEPTNHLDLHARVWLANHLSKVPYAIMIVSHDRYFLNKVTQQTLEIRGQKLHQYSGNINYYLKERQLRLSQAQAAFDKQDQKRAHLQSFVDRFGAKATKAKQAQSRQKQLDAMEILERPDDEVVNVRMRFAEGPPSAAVPIRLSDALIGWDKPLLTGVKLELQKGMRLALIGANGTGKSTLLKTLSGDLSCIDGRVEYGDRTLLGIFHQDLAQALPLEDSPLEYLLNAGIPQNAQEIRTVLGSLGLRGECHTRAMAQLSGGEKARVALCQLICTQSNVLFLDEPTNHLDIETAEALADALQAYQGAICFISHDRSLVEDVATHIGRIEDGRIEVRMGVEPEWLIPQAYRHDKSEEPQAAQSGKDTYVNNKARNKERRQLTKALNATERNIAKTEEALEAIDESLVNAGSDYHQLERLAEDRSKLEEALEAHLNEWERISLLLEE